MQVIREANEDLARRLIESGVHVNADGMESDKSDVGRAIAYLALCAACEADDAFRNGREAEAIELAYTAQFEWASALENSAGINALFRPPKRPGRPKELNMDRALHEAAAAFRKKANCTWMEACRGALAGDPVLAFHFHGRTGNALVEAAKRGKAKINMGQEL